MRLTLKEIYEKYPEDGFLIADGLDDGVIGLDEESMRLVYDVHKCAEVLMQRDGMTRFEAYEFLEFNSIGAYVGEKTPIWVYDEDEDGFEEGQLCNRGGCLGVIEELEKEGGCTCHTGNPPCGHCTSQTQHCSTCGWEAEDA